MKHLNLKNTLQLLSSIVLMHSFFTVQAAGFPEPGNYTNGAKVWADNCGRCHNVRSPDELRDDQWITTLFHMRVRAGLTGQETRDVISFLQKSNTQVSPSSSRISGENISTGLTGSQVYNQTCVACHANNGTGAFPGVPDFTQSDGPLQKSDDVLLTHVVNGFQSPGSPMAMPPKGGNEKLSYSDLEKVLSFIRQSFGR